MRVPTRDGVRLATDIYRPARGGKAVAGRFPAILERSPYGRDVTSFRNITAASLTLREPYAGCPLSGRRCTTLVMPNGGHRFASVKAWRLPYASQNEDVFGLAHRRVAKAEERLARLSKYARMPTRHRAWERIEEAEGVLDYGLASAWARLSRVEARLSAAGQIKKRDLADEW